MKIFKILLIFLLLIAPIIYLTLINTIANLNVNNYFGTARLQQGNDYGEVNLGVSDSVSVQVVRNRFYGKIIENEQASDLYFFNTIKLPLKNHDYNFIWIHVLFLILWVSFLIIFLVKGMVQNKS